MILASKSPRRKELIQRICKDVKIIPSGVDESLVAQKPVEYFAERLARAKADQVAQEHPDELVVGCDTVVILDGEVLGKPENKQHAFEMLSRLSGNTHKVITFFFQLSHWIRLFIALLGIPHRLLCGIISVFHLLVELNSHTFSLMFLVYKSFSGKDNKNALLKRNISS